MCVSECSKYEKTTGLGHFKLEISKLVDIYVTTIRRYYALFLLRNESQHYFVEMLGLVNCHVSHFTVITHWGRVTHICVSKLNVIGSDNGLSPGRRQAIIWTNTGILLIGAVGTNVSEILIRICTFSLKKCFWKCRLEKGGHLVSASMC